MVVRNIKGLGSKKPIPIYHPLPPVSSAIMKIVVSSDSGDIDISNLIISGNFNVGVTSTIGDFEVTFLDPLKTNYNLINLFDDVYIYGDYGTDATTKRFRFKVENKGFLDYKTVLSGRGIGMILAEKSIIYQSLDAGGDLTSKSKSTIITEILQDNFPEITDFSQIETDTTSLQVNYYEIPFFNIIEELCGKDKYFYLDKDLVPHYFTKGSKINTTEAVVEDNLVTMNDNSDNGEEIYSRVRVYGESEGGIPVIATKDLGTTNTGGINKDYIINNSSVTSTTQATELVTSESSNLENSTRIGDIVSLFLPSLLPGESIFVGLPDYDLDPSYYNIKEFSINIDNEGDYTYVTSFTIEKKRVTSSGITKGIVQNQSAMTENRNPYDLDFSRIITFDTDTGTHSGTEINEDHLKVSPGGSIGTWISPVYTLDNNVSEIELRWFGDLLIGDYSTTTSQMWFSLNGGETWQLYFFGIGSYSGTIPTGKDLMVKVVLNKSDARVKRIGVYYKY